MNNSLANLNAKNCVMVQSPDTTKLFAEVWWCSRYEKPRMRLIFGQRCFSCAPPGAKNTTMHHHCNNSLTLWMSVFLDYSYFLKFCFIQWTLFHFYFIAFSIV